MPKPPRKLEITLDYQNYIENAPVAPKTLYSNACSSDGVTMDHWLNIWVSNVKANHAKFKSFEDHGLGKLHGQFKQRPCIIVGSGPSLKHNVADLKNKGDIPVVSCLHNYHLMEDNGIDVDMYVSLDAGEVVIEEVYEGGSKTPEEYWASTKGKKLAAFIGTNPKLFDLWQGEVYLFNCPVPSAAFIKAVKDLETFNTFVSNGGNVLGACLYIAKGIFGANPIAFMGADFAFGYDRKFHAWDSKYDAKMGNVLRTIDVFGNKVMTWQSYHNFKGWFEYVAMQVQGIYYNCTEGGTLGAYPEGNIMAIRQMPIQDFIEMYNMHELIKEGCLSPKKETNLLLF